MKKILPCLLTLAFLLSCADDEKLFHAAVSEVKASSFVVESVLTYGRYHPLMAVDGDPLTAWNEAAKGPGMGEWIEIAFDKPVTTDAINLMPGYYDAQWYQKNNRIKSVELTLNGKTIHAELTDGMDEKTVKLRKETTFSMIRLVIMDVYKGTAYDDTCLAEIAFYLHKRKIEINTDAPKAKLAEDDKKAQIASMDSPMGKVYRISSFMGISTVEFFLSDYTYVNIDRGEGAWETKTIGAWSIGENGEIGIELKNKCFIEGVGNHITLAPPYGDLYADYAYRVESISNSLKESWMAIRQHVAKFTPNSFPTAVIEPFKGDPAILKNTAPDSILLKSLADAKEIYRQHSAGPGKK